MPKIFVDKSIEINAPASKVWEVLTNPKLTKEWIKLWWPDIMVLESDWKLGSPVLWKVSGKIGATGIVMLVDPSRMLSFSFKVNGSSKQENIVYRLEGQKASCTLSISVGDFGDTQEHRLCYSGADEAWNQSLPKIKQLAEK